MNKKDCEKLHNRYKELKEKSTLLGHHKQAGKRCRPRQVTAKNIKDIEELIKVENKLKEEKCLRFLSDNQLIELLDLSCDDDFTKRVEKVLVAKRTIN
jgi:hypothetical protein